MWGRGTGAGGRGGGGGFSARQCQATVSTVCFFYGKAEPPSLHSYGCRVVQAKMGRTMGECKHAGEREGGGGEVSVHVSVKLLYLGFASSRFASSPAIGCQYTRHPYGIR